jgi:CRP-like cAMP-binding protein
MPATPIILPAPEAPQDNNEADKPETQAPERAEASDIAAAIAGADPFAGLADPIIDAIAEGADIRRYSAGQTVFSMGQYDGADAFVVAAGTMRVSVIDGDTGAVIVDDIGEKTAFAVDLTFSGTSHDFFSRLSVTAEEDLALVSIDAEALRELAAQRPSLMRNLAQYFAAELGVRRFNALKAEAAPEQRIFGELLKFVQRDEISGQWRIPRMPKHRELADLADVAENAAAAAIASIIQDGVAHRDYPGLVIADMQQLNVLAGK